MESCGLEVDLGNVAWAPVNDFGSLDSLDRFNGVPTLGTFNTNGSWYLFWRAFHVGNASLWLYQPVTERERKELLSGGDLDGVLFKRRKDCFATVGAAYKNRLIFEREIAISAGLDGEATWRAVMEHARTSLDMALQHDLPHSRRQKVMEIKRELQNA